MQDQDTSQDSVDRRSPAFERAQWNAWGCAFICFLSLLAFVIVETVISTAFFFSAHPRIVEQVQTRTISPDAMRRFVTPASIAQLLSPSHLLVMTLAGNASLILIALSLGRLKLRASFDKLGLGLPVRANQLLKAVPVGLFLLAASSLVAALQTKLFGSHPQLVAQILGTRHGAVSFVLDFLAVSVVAPFGEEVFFRGILFAGLVQRMPLVAAAFLSGAIFAGVHALSGSQNDAWNFAPLLLVGVGLAYLYYRNKTLWPNIVAHSTINTLSLVLAYAVPQLVK